jgi:DNA primase
MRLIPQDVIDQVLAAHDIAEVVGRYVTLKGAGRSMKALCPFHEEKTPSFTVNPERQSFKCFGCGKGGNVFGFLMEHQGLTFPEAVRALASERGIRVPEREGERREEPGRVESILRAVAFAQAFFQRSLAGPAGEEARGYLLSRGYDAEAVQRFGLGYAPVGWDRLHVAAAEVGIGGPLLEEAGLGLQADDGRRRDRFRHRITFPISDLRGKVVTFGARALAPDDQPKYLNGPETPVFRKSSVLFALDRAREAIRRTGEALLMEGYTDVLMAHRTGVDRAVAGMGTAFTPDQAGLLKRFAQRVVLVYDGDDAGRAAAERTTDVLLERGLEVRIASLPEGRDVDEVLLEEGVPAFEAIVASAQDVLDFKVSLLEARLDLESPSGRARAVEALAATVAKVPSLPERDQLFRRIG